MKREWVGFYRCDMKWSLANLNLICGMLLITGLLHLDSMQEGPSVLGTQGHAITVSACSVYKCYGEGQENTAACEQFFIRQF